MTNINADTPLSIAALTRQYLSTLPIGATFTTRDIATALGVSEKPIAATMSGLLRTGSVHAERIPGARAGKGGIQYRYTLEDHPPIKPTRKPADRHPTYGYKRKATYAVPPATAAPAGGVLPLMNDWAQHVSRVADGIGNAVRTDWAKRSVANDIEISWNDPVAPVIAPSTPLATRALELACEIEQLEKRTLERATLQELLDEIKRRYGQ